VLLGAEDAGSDGAAKVLAHDPSPTFEAVR
jgi:hypothetical protein